jgi:hypothetical protein
VLNELNEGFTSVMHTHRIPDRGRKEELGSGKPENMKRVNIKMWRIWKT